MITEQHRSDIERQYDTRRSIASEVKYKLFTAERRRIKEDEIRIFEKLYVGKRRERERMSILRAQPPLPLPSLNPPWVAVSTAQSICRHERERERECMALWWSAWFRERAPPASRHAIMIGQLLLVEQQFRSPNARRGRYRSR